MMYLFLAPEDVWLFRDGRPFDAASSHRARSLFPPYPSVLQGVIRSHQLVLKGVDLQNKEMIIKTVGTTEDYGSLQMRGPFLAKYQGGKLTRFFPRPADWFPVNEESDQIHALTPVKRSVEVSTNTSDVDLPYLLFSSGFKPGKKEYGEWLAEDDLKIYLSGKPVTPHKSKDLFVRESRVGIKLGTATRSTEQGMLYEAEFIRPAKEAGLYLEVNGYDDWPTQGMLKIGGESHAASFQNVEAQALDAPPKSLNGRFKVYFASPAYFKNGWEPSNWKDFFGIEIKPVAVALQGHDTIGGFDYARHGDKPSLRYVPAGSVYFFESEKEISSIAPVFAEAGSQIGFGQVIFANW
jgi:CRISPR-associated protein Cmr3